MMRYVFCAAKMFPECVDAFQSVGKISFSFLFIFLLSPAGAPRFWGGKTKRMRKAEREKRKKFWVRRYFR
jgi:hypothetical protein